MTNFDNREFRNALGTFATGITVVTTTNDKLEPVGITVNSFTSVSLEPPLILWCLDNEADSHGAFSACDNFTVHVLHEGQEVISQIFSSENNDRFAGLEWEQGEFGSPVLKDFATCLNCRTEKKYDAGDHIILLGRVISFESHQHKKPLIYHGGAYQHLKS
ncbi:MAG: flavin reductase (DIM6/NTAB) family NADH-FMN oxidoreductase RutF [Gammaproteobacteria bacterium]|jgi:flavin reductase (DIM6/NTAB) family NADH-FMN oxidoreductase RutF